jgi:phage terminase large subunit-like protein
VNEVPGPPHWIDSKRLEGERRRLPDSSFRRLFLNQWTASEDRLASEDDLAACVTLDGPQEPRAGVRYVIGLDIGLTSDATVATVCHAETITGSEHPRVVVDRIQAWKGSRVTPVQLSVVEEWVEEVSRRYGLARARFDPYQAIHLSQRLKKVGIPVGEFTFSAASVGKLAMTLLQLIREHALALPSDADLLDELRNVRLRESSPGVFRLDHDRNRHDDRAVALALAATWLVERPTPQPMRTSSPFHSSRLRATQTAPGPGTRHCECAHERTDSFHVFVDTGREQVASRTRPAIPGLARIAASSGLPRTTKTREERNGTEAQAR